MTRFRKPTTSKQDKRQSASTTLRPTDLVSRTPEAARRTTKVSTSTDFQKLSIGSTSALKGIQFGSPSGTGAKSHNSPNGRNEWTNLLSNATSGGVESLIGGGFLQSGINSLFSGITSLFDGGGKSEPSLVRFPLPDSQQQTMYMTSNGLSSSVGNVASFQSNSQRENDGSSQSQGPLYRQSEIVQAVKTALLTSSSLNDVIAEI